jgi:hypothetical protein
MLCWNPSVSLPFRILLPSFFVFCVLNFFSSSAPNLHKTRFLTFHTYEIPPGWLTYSATTFKHSTAQWSLWPGVEARLNMPSPWSSTKQWAHGFIIMLECCYWPPGNLTPRATPWISSHLPSLLQHTSAWLLTCLLHAWVFRMYCVFCLLIALISTGPNSWQKRLVFISIMFFWSV